MPYSKTFWLVLPQKSYFLIKLWINIEGYKLIGINKLMKTNFETKSKTKIYLASRKIDWRYTQNNYFMEIIIIITKVQITSILNF